MTRSFVGVSPYHLAPRRAAARDDRVLRHALSEAFGLSYHLSRRGDRTIVGHTGEQSGFPSFSYLDPASTMATTDDVRAVELVGP